MDFNAIKDRARKMIHDDAKKDSHIIRERVRDRNSSEFYRGQPMDEYSSYDTVTSIGGQQYSSSMDYDDSRLNEAIDQRMNEYMASRNAQQMPQQQTANFSNSKMPKEILESFSENYIDQSAFDPRLAQISTQSVSAQPRQVVNEIVQQQSLPKTSGIDYELIKSIIESSVKKYVNALGKKLLNESKINNSDGNIKAVQFTGDKFMMVTKGGDVYEANMVFKKNLKEK